MSGATEPECVFDLAHDRETEAAYFLLRMRVEYHDPAGFRFNLNAFLNALNSLGDMTRLDLERHHLRSWWLSNKRELYDDPVLHTFREGRNFAVHRGTLLKGSQIEAGLFRGRELKLAEQLTVTHDRSSHDILRHVVAPQWTGVLVDAAHTAVGEQLGVRRTYRVAELSPEQDVFTACHLAFTKASAFLDRAHEAFGGSSEGLHPDAVLQMRVVSEFDVLLESDLDPGAPGRWGWASDSAQA